MVRNAILVIATFGVLGVLFVGYQSWMQIDSAEQVEQKAPLGKIERAADQETSGVEIPLQDNAVTIPAGEGGSFRSYEPYTGRLVRLFKWKRWHKVADTRGEVEVTEPVVEEHLANGMVVTLRAGSGRMMVEGIDRNELQPKNGHLESGVEIRITSSQESDGSARGRNPLEDFLIRLDRLDFDLELGELQAKGALVVRSPMVELDGDGFQMVWNQADNRIESMVIERGEKLTLRLDDGLMAGLRGDTSAGAKKDAPQSQPTERLPRSVTTYSCVLAGNVSATHYRGDRAIGELTSDELRLLFDVDSSARRMLRDDAQTEEQPGGADAKPGPTSAPVTSAPTATAPAASQPSEPAEPERLVVRWNGPLNLVPLMTEVTAAKLRRQIDARGDDVSISFLRPGGQVLLLATPVMPGGITSSVIPIARPEHGTIRCGGLEYHEDTDRLWVRPGADGRVRLSLSDLDAAAGSIYLDGDRNIVKLVDDVLLRSQAKPGRGGDKIAIRCKQWAELHLAHDAPADSQEGGRDLNALGSLESAAFVGSVDVNISGKSLRAHRLETYFAKRPERADALATQPAANKADKTAGAGLTLERAVASGNARLKDGERQLRAAWMEIAFALDEQDELYAQSMHAIGPVTLYDPEHSVAAWSRELTAKLTAGNTLESARLDGAEAQPAHVLAEGYEITGGSVQLWLDPNPDLPVEQSLRVRVPGKSRLQFTATRGLRGERRRRATPVVVTSEQWMEVDARTAVNTVQFVGNVKTSSGDEHLESDDLTLHLKDVINAPKDEAEATGGPRAFARAISPAAVQFVAIGMRLTDLAHKAIRAAQGKSDDDGLFVRRNANAPDVDKEPVRLVAHNAAIVSETLDPRSGKPIVLQRIAAPELFVEIPERTIHTVGRTVLGMTSLQPPSSSDAAEPRDVVPSALLARGPSETALMCERSMTYVLGEDGPNRRDSVLFEGGVRFRHVTGREMQFFEQLMPEVANNPDLLAQLRDRNTRVSCEKLELVLLPRTLPSRALTTDSPMTMQLSWLNATGNVWLQDRVGAGLREIRAKQIEFDRDNATVRVLGDKETKQEAQVMYQNEQEGRYDRPVRGYSITVFLDTNTIKADEGISGRVSP